MRTKFYYLALAALVFCWQVIYIVLPLPHGEAYWACEIFTVLLVLNFRVLRRYRGRMARQGGQA